MSSGPNANSFRNGQFYKRWLSDKSTYPLFIIMGCAVALVAFAGSRTLFAHPDVYLNKSDRHSLIRDSAEARGKAHSTNWVRDMARSKNDSDSISIWPSLNRSMLARHVNPEIADQHLDDQDQE